MKPIENYKGTIPPDVMERMRHFVPPKLDTITKAYPAPGFCLVCTNKYDDVRKPTKEHIVPRCLSKTGEMYIIDGTCENCNSRMNKEFENLTFQQHLPVARAKLGLKRGDKKRPIVPPKIAIGHAKSNEDFDTQLDVDDYPEFFNLLQLEMAGKLCNVDRSKGFRLFKIVTVFTGPQKPTDTITTKTDINPALFALTVCKMAYLYACAERGIDNGFDGSEMRALLMGERDDSLNFFGGASPLYYPRRDHLHELYVREIRGYLTVVVFLFATFGIPGYEVVVGPLTKPE